MSHVQDFPSVAAWIASRVTLEELQAMLEEATRRAERFENDARSARNEVLLIEHAVRESERAARSLKHGTAGTYNKGCRCDLCRTARVDYQRTYRARRRLKGAA